MTGAGGSGGPGDSGGPGGSGSPGGGLLAPVVDDDGAPFWAYAARGELRVQACA
ncbi:hypothetical protein GUY61_37315, partial [Streptomyces sp. GC420]|nr:hypothetical protein [Streptomyces sp. GC420]